MSFKRSRESDSNFIEKDALNHASSTIESVGVVCGSSSQVMKPPPKCLKPTIEEGNNVKFRPNLVLAPLSHGSINRGFKDFLEYCHFCCKKIDQDKDLYMYRDLGAFCSEDCRSLQMELDKKKLKEHKKSDKAAAQEEDGKGKPMFF